MSARYVTPTLVLRLNGRVTSGRAIVVGDSIVRCADRIFCGNRRDYMVLCCVPGARARGIPETEHGILESRGGSRRLLCMMARRNR